MVTIANRYQLQDKLGEGGMGAVYRAFDPLEQTTVALKRVNQPVAQLQFNSKGAFSDERTAMVQEFRTLASLRHPNIISVLDYGFDDEQNPFFTMDLLDNAATMLDYDRAQSDQEKALLLVQTLQALIYLHRRDILHRDLKPANVLVTADGTVKVLDFGLSASTTQAQGTAGTLAYMAPEVLREQPVSRATDLYAVGMMAYELLIGKYPFEAKNPMRLIQQIVQTIPDVSSITNPALQMVMVRWLMKDSEDRYQSAQATILALCDAVEIDPPQESITIRESFLQASEFVGRDAELKTLQDELASVMAGATSFYLVGGESGVGKSRLLEELRTHALVSGARVLRGQAVEGGGLPFQLWRQIVRRLLLMVEVTDLQAGILKDIVPDIDELLGRKIAKAPELTGTVYQERLVLTIVDLLRKVKQPLVLILEDLQWTIESLAVLRQLLLVREQFDHLMVIGNYRNDEAPNLPDELTGMGLIRLDRLDSDSTQRLSQSMLGEGGASEQVVELLQTETEGNLFFLIETVRALAEEAGSLEQIGKATLPNKVFTGGMQHLMQSRLNKVDATYAPIQKLAAVIGREIDMDRLVHQHDRTQVEDWLINASEHAILDIQDNQWRFAHDKLREALIADVPGDELPMIHRTAAETIEAVYPDDTGYNEALLNHWQQVDEFDKIYHYALPVAKNMIEVMGTYTTAETLLQILLDRLPKDDTRRIPPLNLLSRNAGRQGNYDSGKTYATQAQQLSTMHDNLLGLASSLNNLGNIATQQGDYERATDLFQQSLTICKQLGDQYGIAASLNNLGRTAWSQGDYEKTIDFCQQSLTIYQQLGDQSGIAHNLNLLGIIAQLQGEYDRATDLYQQSLTIYQQLGAQYDIALSLNNMGLIAGYQGDYIRTTDLLQKSLVIRQQLGDQHGISQSLGNLGGIAYLQRDYERAMDLHQQSLTIRQQLGEQHGIAMSLSNIGWIKLKQGDLKASDHLHEGLAISETINTPLLSIYFVVSFAGVLIHKTQAARAAHLLGFVAVHPLKQPDLQERIDDLLPLLEAALSPDELQAALERGKSLDLDTIVAELLDEFAPTEDDNAT